MIYMAEHQGELAALLAALLWALSSVLFGRIGQQIRALELNLFKGALAIGMVVVTMLVTGESLIAVAPLALGYLLLSGVIGIGMGDTAYFQALKHLGARRTLLVGILAPPLTGLISWGFLKEQLSSGAWLGTLLTVAGVGWVITERTASPGDNSSLPWRGVAFALLATLAQSVGVLLSRAAFTQTNVSALQSTILRLVAGEIFLLGAILLLHQRIGGWSRGRGSARRWLTIGLATLLGTYLGVLLQQTALVYARAAVVQTLISTSPLFVLPVAALSGEKVSLRAIGGALLAMLGVIVLFSTG